MIATKANRKGERDTNPRRHRPSMDRTPGPSPVIIGRPTRLLDTVITAFHRTGIPASYGGAPDISRPLPAYAQVHDRSVRRRDPLPAEQGPIGSAHQTAGETTASIIVIADRPLIADLFGEHTGSGAGIRLFHRARRVRSVERQICDMATSTALAIAARRLLIVCDAGRTSPAERTRAIRWVRGLAHRIGYECAMNGLPALATSYTMVVSETEVEHSARIVVDWCRCGQGR